MNIQVLNHFMQKEFSGSESPLAIHKEDHETFTQLFEQELADREETEEAALFSQIKQEEEETKFTLPENVFSTFSNEIERVISNKEEIQIDTNVSTQPLQEGLQMTQEAAVLKLKDFLVNEGNEKHMNLEEVDAEALESIFSQEVNMDSSLETIPVQHISSTIQSLMNIEQLNTEEVENVLHTVLSNSEQEDSEVLQELVHLREESFLTDSTLLVDNASNESLLKMNDTNGLKEIITHSFSETNSNESKPLVEQVDHPLLDSTEPKEKRLHSLNFLHSEIDWTSMSDNQKKELIEALDQDIRNTAPLLHSKDTKIVKEALEENISISVQSSFKERGSDSEATLAKQNQRAEQLNPTQTSTTHQVSQSSGISESPVLNQAEAFNRIEAMMTEFIQESSQPDTIRTTIQLTPERLGEMEIQLEWRNNEFFGRMLVTSNETKEWMENQLRELSHTMHQGRLLDTRHIDIQVVSPTSDTDEANFQSQTGSQNQGRFQGDTSGNPNQSSKKQNIFKQQKNYRIEDNQEIKIKRTDEESGNGRLSLLV